MANPPRTRDAPGFLCLQRLDLENTRVTDTGIAELKKALPKVRVF